MEPPEMAADRELALLISTGIKMLTKMVPGWKPPVRALPHAVSYGSAADLFKNAVPGDQVIVVMPDGHQHHGIFVGNDKVVSCWGVRALGDFVRGSTGFAKAVYTWNGALRRELSARLALDWADAAADAGHPREEFATICRCMWYAVACHDALTQQLSRRRPPTSLEAP